MKGASLSARGKRVLFAAVLLICFGIGLWIRLDALTDRPLHADEATGARLLGQRLEAGDYRFDPTHFHGPLLSAAAAPIARLRGETDWASLTPQTLRLGVAWLGALTVLLACAFRPWLGSAGAVGAGLFIAVSPYLAYYSRVFIHETLFGFLTLATLLALLHYARKPGTGVAALVGVAAGLLMATRETFVLCFAAWGAAAVLIAWETRRSGELVLNHHVRARGIRDAGVALVLALATVAVFYTNAGKHPAGFLDFFRTFFLYETGEGHERPWWHYGWMLVWPKHQGGMWWTEGAVAVLAVLGYLSHRNGSNGRPVRFLFYSGLFLAAVFSLFPYKTPWLFLVPWLHFCLVAGAGAGALLRYRPLYPRLAAVAAVVVILGWHKGQADRALHRYASDTRNPYAYVPTSPDVERVAALLGELAELFPDVRSGPVAVIGSGYWPLPWYLRELPAVGYWETIPEEAMDFPVLLALPAERAAVHERLEATHAVLPRGLRADTAVFVFIRHDLWERYLDQDDEEVDER